MLKLLALFAFVGVSSAFALSTTPSPSWIDEWDTTNPMVQPRRFFDGCKLDPELRFSNNVFYKCQNPDKASEAALSVSPPGSRHGMCHDPHKPQPGFYAHYHPAGHQEVDGFNYHFHWGSEEFGQCPWSGPKGGAKGGVNPNYKGKNYDPNYAANHRG